MYLRRLHSFLLDSRRRCDDGDDGDDGNGDACTGLLARMVGSLQSEYRPYFLFGSGSNERNQLLLRSPGTTTDGCTERNDDDDDNYDYDDGVDDLFSNEEGVHELTEMLLVVPRSRGVDDNDKGDAAFEANGGDSSSSSSNALKNASRDDDPRSLHAGGGHSALLTHGGDLYLWGSNDAGQLGRPRMDTKMGSIRKSTGGEGSTAKAPSSPCPLSRIVVPSLSDIMVEAAALGHAHTLVIEKDTGRLFGFGDDGRGQVSGCATAADPYSCHAPRTTPSLGLSSEEGFVRAAAGLFHSAAITRLTGELITWGCGRFGQCLRPMAALTGEKGEGRGGVGTSHENEAVALGASTVGRWRPPDGSKLVQVACGRRHTVVLDEYGRVWTLGDNKHGQLGRSSSMAKRGTLSNAEPQLVDGPLGEVNSGCFAICSGWSHILALTRDGIGHRAVTLHGWGRNDKGQLGIRSLQDQVLAPRALEPMLDSERAHISDGGTISIQAACCGAESSHILDVNGKVYSTGWNEHGNLAVGHVGNDVGGEHSVTWMAASGAGVVAPPPTEATGKLIAAGGAHLIAMAV